MAIYENMPPDGHLTFTERIFTKIKNLFDTKVQTDVPANAIFTDEKVTQIESAADENYEILVSGTTSTETITERTKKNEGLLYNPNKKALMIGTNTYVSTIGTNSFAQGAGVAAIGTLTHAEGLNTSAYGTAAHTEGYYTTAVGSFTHSEGFSNIADGTATHVEGYMSTVGGVYNHVEGMNNYGYGQGIHVEGYRTYASDLYNHVEGESNTVKGYANHIEGYYNQINGSTASHIEGYHNYINASTASHAEGYDTTVTGNYSHSEGNYTHAVGDKSHSEGNFTTASGYTSHSEGDGTLASGQRSHAEGYYTIAQGHKSHTEGHQTKAIGEAAHTEGGYTTATGNYSHAEGENTQTLGSGSHAEGEETTAGGRFSHAEGYDTYTQGNFSHAEGERTLANGGYSHAEGQLTTANGLYSHAEGYVNYAGGSWAHAEGWWSKALGHYSHTEGGYTTAGGNLSHAEGQNTYAMGNGSHAEGYYTYAQGENSHAEGYHTYTRGKNSHTAGNNTTALFSDSYVFGAYNLPDGYDSTVYSDRGNYVEIVGNGLSSTQLSNARTLDWDGNEWVAAGVSVDGLSSTTEGETSTTVQTSSAHLQNKSLTLSDTTDTITPSETEGEDPTIETEKHVIEVTPEDIILDDTWDGSRTSLKETVTFLGSQSAANKVDKSGDTMTGDLNMDGMNVNFKTSGSDSDDSGDIAFYYGNGQEKARIWTANTYITGANSGIGPNYRAYKDDGTQIASGRLLCSFGDHMTGDLYFDSASIGICYKGTQSSGRMIRFIDNPSDAYGNGISIGAGGTTIIGGGESASAMESSLSGGGSELMYIGNDGDVNIHTNLQNGWDSRKTFTFSAGGRLTIPEYCYASYFHQSSGAETPSTGSYFIYCNSDGFFRKSTRLNAAKALTNQAVSSPGYVVSLTDNWGTFGYTTIAQLKAKFGYGTIVTKNTGDYIATTGGNITGTNRFKLNNNQEIYQNQTYLILGTSNMVCVRTYNDINAAKPIQAASFQTYSSRLVKENITDITQDEAKSLLNLRVVDFDYIEQVGGQTNQTGIIAEEALTIYPKCVEIPENYNEDEVKKAIETGGAINAMNIDYTKLVAPLIKLVQMQQKEIDDLKAVIKTS